MLDSGESLDDHRLRAMLEHPAVAHAIAAMSDEEIADIVAEHSHPNLDDDEDDEHETAVMGGGELDPDDPWGDVGDEE